MLSALWTDTNIDAIQTAAIITLTVVVSFRVLRENARITQVHDEQQDANRSQWDLLKQIKQQGDQIAAQTEQIAALTQQLVALSQEMAEKCGVFERRIRELEGAPEPPRTRAA